MNKIENKVIKTAAIVVMIFLFTASAAQAVVKMNDHNDNNSDITLMGDNYKWEDPFNSAQKIDLTHSENYIVEGGKVKMIDTYEWWTDEDWERAKIVSLSSTISGEVRIKVIVDYDTDMRNDYGDVRFKFQNDNAWLNYWIEEKNPEPSDPYAIFWLKIPNLPTGNSKMYMFYMNDDPSVDDESDYWSVFDQDSWSKAHVHDERITNHWYKEGAWDADVCFGEHDNEDVFLVFWEEGTAYWPAQGTQYQQQIRACYYDLDGIQHSSGRFDIVDEPDEEPPYRYENPSAQYGKGDKFFVAYECYNDWSIIYQQFTDMDIEGAIVDNPVDGAAERFTICDANSLQADPCVAFDDTHDRFLVVWEDGRQGTSNYDIYGRFYDWDGDPIGGDFAIRTEPRIECEPWVAFDNENNHYFIVWEESTTSDPENGPFEIWGQMLDWQGNEWTTAQRLSQTATADNDYNFPCVAFCELPETFLVTWQKDDISDGDWTGPIYGHILDEYGDTDVDIFLIANGDYCRTDITPYLTTSYFVSYDNWAGNSGDIWGKMVNATGAVNSYTLQLSDSDSEPADWANIASDGNRIYVTWEDERVDYQNPFDFMPDLYFNIWSLNIPTGDDVTYSYGDEISMILNAHIISKEINPENWVEWVLFDAIKTGDVDFDILDGETLQILIPNVSPGANIDSINTDNIRLKARFSRTVPSYSPELDYWKVEYIGVDTEPPLTSVYDRDGVRGNNDIWISDGVIIWLMAVDFPEDTGSGVDKTYYTLNNDPTEIYNEDSGMQLSVNSGTNWLGEWDIYYWSVDNEGNVETPKKYEWIKIDADPPNVNIYDPPNEEAEVEIPFWIKAYPSDNDEIDYVEFNIEPFEAREPYRCENEPWQWWCDVDQISRTHTRALDDDEPQPAGVNAMIRAKAYDMSGQSWIHEFPVYVKNWGSGGGENENVERVLINNNPLLGMFKLGFTVDKTLNINSPIIDDADSVKFVATKIFTRQKTIVWDKLSSDGFTTSFNIPTGLYRLDIISYRQDEEIARNVARVIFISQ